jgi:hypothetical protein
VKSATGCHSSNKSSLTRDQRSRRRQSPSLAHHLCQYLQLPVEITPSHALSPFEEQIEKHRNKTKGSLTGVDKMWASMLT